MAEELVRVRFNGVEKNMGRSFAEATGVEVLDDPTTRGDRTARPTTREGGRRRQPKTTVAKSAAEKKAVTSASVEKENQS